MKINIEPNLLKKLPKLKLGCIEANVNIGTSSQELNLKIDNELSLLKDSLTPESIRQLNTVKATKDAYRKLGKDPNRYRPAAESLMRRIANGKGLYQISNVVDTLNLISVKTGFSICGYDFDLVEGDVYLGIGKTDEPYEGIGRGQLNIELLPVFRDNKGPFGTPTSDSTRTMITTNTKHILFIFMDFEGINTLEDTLIETVHLLEEYSGGQNIKTYII
jgi:DNA/RNA-binding domain of Phe-tRNA-synthetase-like protein